MSKIRGINTTPEVSFRKKLWSLGYRYRKNYKNLHGKPDIVFTKSKVAIFIDGEFWHGYNWEEKKTRIKSNREYWIKKIERNMERDKKNVQLLGNEGWNVIRFWVHEIQEKPEECLQTVIKTLY